MKTQPSLRTLLLAGLVGLQAAVLTGVVCVVYARARSEARAALGEDLRLRARTLAGILELGSKGLEFDLPRQTMPEYMSAGTGSYAVIHDATGRTVVRSPSLGPADLAATAPWEPDGIAFAEVARGPDGIPCATATHSFVVRVDDEKPSPGWTPPAPELRRYQIVVAADSRPRDARLGALLSFLVGIAAAALAATAAGGLLVARWVLQPIRRMTQEAAELRPDDPSRRLRPETVARELHSLSETLNSALDRLRVELDRQRRFASDASHELRTPLAVLLGNTELLLRRERTPQEYRDGLERQRRTAQRMTRITENLLALARADDGRVPLRRTRVDLRDVVRGVCDELTPAANEAGVALEFGGSDAAEVDGDVTYLEILVQNLVANAVKFTPRGGTVRASVSVRGESAAFVVADTGDGIPAEFHERIFERFHRVKDGGDPREGAGLGLALAAWVAAAHGGRIEVASVPGTGSAFTVLLPLQRANAIVNR